MRYQPDELFRSTAAYYARYRPGYPPEFFAYLARRFHLDGSQHILDLGCGTGQIALRLAANAARVHAVDPEPGMLAEGERQAAEYGITSIDWILGDSYHLKELALPPLALVTMGAAFHWMDRPAVLACLDTLVIPGGAVVIASGGRHPDRQSPPWDETIAAIRARYLGPDRRAGSGTYTHPEETHADVLRQSPFSVVETRTWDWEIERDLDSLIGLQFSYSFSAPALFSAGQREAFERDLRAAVTDLNPSGIFTEHIQTEAITGTRP